MKKILSTVAEKIKHFLADKLNIKSNEFQYLILGGVALLLTWGGLELFLNLTRLIKRDNNNIYDERISDYIHSFRTPALTKYFTIITDMGDIWGYVFSVIVASIITYALTKKWKYAVEIFVMLVLAISSNLVLKHFIDRARPTAEHLVEIKTLSYPSGHAMTSMAFYGFIIYLLIKTRMNQGLKIASIGLLIFFILNVGISRIYLGVHYPTDVAGGYIAGFIWVVFNIFISNMWKVYKDDPNTQNG